MPLSQREVDAEQAAGESEFKIPRAAAHHLT